MFDQSQSEKLENLSHGANLIHKSIIEEIAEPETTKQFRLLPTKEAAELIPISDSRLRALSREEPELFPSPSPIGTGTRVGYTVEQVNETREKLFQKTGDEKYRRGRLTGDKLQVIAVSNFKGGVAKTTTAAHLASYLALNGYRTLVIDADNQASLTDLFGFIPDDDFAEEQTTAGLLLETVEDPRNAIHGTHIDRLDIVPANLFLQEAEWDLPNKQVKVPGFQFYSVLKRQLERVQHDYDFVVIDCPPSLSYITMNALWAATSVVVPVVPNLIDFRSTGHFFGLLKDTLQPIAETSGEYKQFDMIKVLTTRFNTQDRTQQYVAKLMAAHFGNDLLISQFASSAAIDAASSEVQTLYEVSKPQNRETYRRGREHVDGVCSEILSLLLQVWDSETSNMELAV